MKLTTQQLGQESPDDSPVARALSRKFWIAPLDDPSAPRCEGAHPRGFDRTICDDERERGKHPLGRWKDVATADPSAAAKLFGGGAQHNVAIACGPSGIFVIDADSHGEFERWCNDQEIDVPETYTVDTGKGAHHYFLQPVDAVIGNRNPFKDLGYNIDVRGAGGYVVGEGSVHQSGSVYTARNPETPIAPAPSILLNWLLPLVNRKITRGTNILGGKRSLSELLKNPPTRGAGQTNDWLTRVAGHYAKMHRDKRDLYEVEVRRAAELVGGYEDTEKILESIWATETGVASRAGAGRTLVVRSLADVESEFTEWAIDGIMPLGVITGVAGTAGIGKSTTVSWFIAGLTRGLHKGDLSGTPVRVLLAAGEDDTSRQLKPRLLAAKADLTLVDEFVPSVKHADGQEYETILQIGEDLPAIRQLLIDTGARVLVLDPILSFVDGNPNQQRDVRAALDPLAALARELNIAVLVVMHFNKGHGVAGEKLSGSHVWRDTLRSLLVMTIDSESGHRIITVDKLNYAPAGRSLAFDVVGTPLQIQGRTVEVATAVYLGDSEVSVQDILDRDQRERDGRHRVGDDTAKAIEFICENGPVTTTVIYAALGLGERAEQINLSKRLSRAVKNGHIALVSKGIYGPPEDLVTASAEGGF